MILLLFLLLGCDYPRVHLTSKAHERAFYQACNGKGNGMIAKVVMENGQRYAKCVDSCPQFIGCTIP